MQKRKLAAILAALALAVSGVLPAVAAPPTNTNIVVGTSTTSGVPNIQVDIATTSATVSLTIKIAGSVTAPGGTNAGSYNIAGGAKIIKNPGAQSAGVFHRDSADSTMNAVNTETGVVSVGGGSFTGNFSAGNVTTNPINYSQVSLGGQSGEVVVCLPLSYYHASNSSETIWYCTQTFVWPEAAPSYQQCAINGTPVSNINTYALSRNTLTSGESYYVTLGGQQVGADCTVPLAGGIWFRTSVNSTVVATTGASTATNLIFRSTPSTYTALVSSLVLNGYTTPIQSGDIWKREIFLQSSSPVSGDQPTITVTLTLDGPGGGNSTPSPAPAPAVYQGPQILAIDNPRPIVSGGALVFSGKNLDAVSQATIGAKTASLSFNATIGLTIGTPAGLAPGKYDLVIQSSFGKLTFINGVSIKAPTPTATIGFRSDAPHLNENQVSDLVAFNQTLNPDYEKVRCIVNASDPKTAKRIADLVCAQVARGEARNVEVIKDIRNTYSGEGFWVRVYAAG